MALNVWEKPQPKPGDYVRVHGQDTEDERRQAADLMRQQGCAVCRFEPLPDGRLLVHGYVSGTGAGLS